MKKVTISILFMVFALSLDACTKERIISFDQLPQKAQTIITTYFSIEEVMIVKLDKDDLQIEYDVKLKNGTELTFDSKGDLIEIDCHRQRVPDGLVPENVRAFVTANHPTAFVTEWSKNKFRLKVELNNGLELVFNNDGDFIRYED